MNTSVPSPAVQQDFSVSAPAMLTPAEAAEFAAWYEEYRPALLRMTVRATGSPDDAEDIVQATFLRAMEDRHKIRNRETVRGWFFGIAKNLIRQRARGLERMPTSSIDELAMELVDRVDLASYVENRDVIQATASAVRWLRPRYKRMILLQVVDGVDTTEAARVLGVSAGEASLVAKRSRDALAQAARVELVARHRGVCHRIPALVPDPKYLDRTQYSQVRGHMRSCATCRRVGDQLVTPNALLGSVLVRQAGDQLHGREPRPIDLHGWELPVVR